MRIPRTSHLIFISSSIHFQSGILKSLDVDLKTLNLCLNTSYPGTSLWPCDFVTLWPTNYGITRSFGCPFGCHTPYSRREPIVPAFQHRGTGGYGDTTHTVTWAMQLVKNGWVKVTTRIFSWRFFSLLFMMGLLTINDAQLVRLLVLVNLFSPNLFGCLRKTASLISYVSSSNRWNHQLL